MVASTPLGVFTLFFGWLMHNQIFAVVAETGLIYLPMLIMLVRHVMESLKEGKDEGNPAWLALKRIEIDGLVMVIVITLCMVPASKINIQTVTYDRSTCEDPSFDASNKKTTYDSAFQNLNGMSARVPVWWGLVSSISSGITGATLRGLPCGTNWGTTVHQINQQKITSPALRSEMTQFLERCFQPAIAKASQQGMLTDEADTSWMGSSWLLSTPGLYDTIYTTLSLDNFNINAEPNSSYDLAEGGRPNCKDWWLGPAADVYGDGMNDSLRQRILDNFNPSTWEKMRQAASGRFGLSTGATEDAMLQAVVSQSKPWEVYLTKRGQISDSQFEQDGVGVGSKLAVAGMFKGQLGQAANREAIKMVVPMLVNFMLMIIVMLLPLILIFGMYRLDLVFQLSLAIFSLYFFRYLWGVAQWMEDKLWDALSSNSVTVTEQVVNASVVLIPARPLFAAIAAVDAISGNEPSELIYVQNALYLLVFTLYFGMMTWAGFKIGNLSGMISSSSQAAGGAAQKMGDQVADKLQDAAVKVATKGLVK